MSTAFEPEETPGASVAARWSDSASGEAEIAPESVPPGQCHYSWRKAWSDAPHEARTRRVNGS